ncbi:MAG: AraC family transcriptional regulator [Alphaproteobacteria bacterium]|nr:AraC family transcriptional regulator [Alphaproteobacteria bacterium]
MELDRLLRAMNVEVHDFALCTLGKLEQHRFERSHLASVHYVVEGHGTIKLDSGQSLELKPHFFLVIPPDMRFEIVSSVKEQKTLPVLGQVCQSVPKDWKQLGKGTSENCGLQLLCGQVEALYGQAIGLFNMLDTTLFADFSGDSATMYHFHNILDDLAHDRPGHLAMAENLLQRCFILILQQECNDGHCKMPWLTALGDTRLSKVLQVMMDNRKGSHSLEDFANYAGMSRASFAAHFQSSFGKSPMAFYNDIRLREAAKLLKTTDWPVKRVANHIGYASRSHFESSFKKFSGSSPTQYRAVS